MPLKITRCLFIFMVNLTNLKKENKKIKMFIYFYGKLNKLKKRK